jgi:uncharacterized Fe-S center protein
MASKVYFGSAHQARLDGRETLPAKLDLIIEQLHIRERVKGETVAIKMHTGQSLGYSTVHPLFVHKVVAAVKEGGGKPFVTDVGWDLNATEERGYTTETLGCPIYGTTGINDKYAYPHDHPFKGIKTWYVAGMIEDASFMINLAHVKGHPSCGFGAAFKNLALGCVTGVSRSAIHDTMHYDQYWFGEKCPDMETRKRIMAACPFGAIVEDKKHPGELHMHFEECNQCGRCLKVAPEGSLKISPVNFRAFQEACAISVQQTLSTFAPGKVTHLSLATHMTPVCDCFGFTGMPILPDAGVFGSDDIVAIDQAALDATGRTKLIEENVPTTMEVHTREGHPFRWLHGPYKDPYLVVQYGEQLGLGSRDYELIDVLPVDENARAKATYISAN